MDVPLWLLLLLPFVVIPALGLPLLSILLRLRRQPNTVGFFHPYSDDGGGGERVLWCAIAALHQACPWVKIVVFTAPPRDGSDHDAIIRRAKDKFNIEISGPVQFVWLYRRRWVEATSWPRVTMLGQSIGSLILGMEALLKLNPSCYIDSMGYGFTLPLARFVAGCQVGAYVHYPTISSDMEEMVASGQKSHNNSGAVSGSRLKTAAKLMYYRAFKAAYSIAGMSAKSVMVNSTWTRNHIVKMWGANPRIVYPPCNVDRFQAIQLGARKQQVVSIGQFRPEKNHALQIEALAHLIDSRPEAARIELVMMGSVRTDEDQARVDALEALAAKLGVAEQLDLRLNVSFDQLIEAYSSARAGMHTMWNEHFGIGVVEMMAAGLVTIGHNSGGPKMDIIEDGETGFLAATAIEYARAMEKAFFEMDDAACIEMSKRARASSIRFTDSGFSEGFVDAVAPLIPKPKQQ